MMRPFVLLGVLLVAAVGAHAQATLQDGATLLTNGATLSIQTGAGLVSNVTFNPDGSVVLLDGLTLDVRAPVAPATWNLTRLNATSILLEGNPSANGTMRVAGFNGSYVVRGVHATPPFRVNGTSSATWNLPAGQQTVNMTPWSGFAPYTTGSFGALGTNRTTWTNHTVTLTTVSNDSVVASTYHKVWRDGATPPPTWTNGTSVAVNGNLVGEWTVQFYAVDALESAEEVREDKVVVGRTHALTTGWTLLYLEGMMGSKNVSDALGELAGRLEVAWTYDVANGWRVYQPTLPDDLRVNWTVNQSTPLFIKVNGTGSALLHDGYRVAPASGNVTLAQGWNVVQPLKWRDPTPVSTVFANVQALNAVWRFDPATQTWVFWNPANPLSNGSFTVDQTTPTVLYMNTSGWYSW